MDAKVTIHPVLIATSAVEPLGSLDSMLCEEFGGWIGAPGRIRTHDPSPPTRTKKLADFVDDAVVSTSFV